MFYRIILAGFIIAVLSSSAAEKRVSHTGRAMPAFRIEAEGFGSSASDIKAVCDSAGSQLWRHFSQYEIDPFVVKRGNNGPFFGYKKNDQGELEILLDTRHTYWSQYAYQFSHEFCHMLCGRGKKDPAQMWFEETLAETASLFAMRAMAREWKMDPPYPNWKDYSDALRTYVDEIEVKRGGIYEIYEKGLGVFYRTHQERLRQECCDRELNGAMAVVLLRLFEEQPQNWEAVRWLNSSELQAGQTFQQHLRRWESAVPERHKSFVRKVASLYGAGG